MILLLQPLLRVFGILRGITLLGCIADPERGISMMVTFLLGEMPTRDEEQKHNLLVAASEHCRRYPDLKTVTLMVSNQNEQTCLLQHCN